MAANQPPPARPWFRLGSMVRPALAPTPTPTPEAQPQPPAPQPRPPVVRAAFTVPFRPPTAQAQPTQPQEPAPPPPAAAAAPPPPAVVQPPPASAVAPPSPASPPPPVAAVAPPPAAVPPPPAATSASVPTSPLISRTIAPSSSLPGSPVPKATTSSTTFPITSSSAVSSPLKPKTPASSSVPSSPAPKPAPSSTVPTSPFPKAAASSSVPTSPAPKPAPSSSAPTFTAFKAAPPSSSVPTSPTIKAASTVPTTTTARVPTPVPSPKIIKPAAKTSPQSPKITPRAPPPSPLVLPPSQLKTNAEPEHKIPLEVEQKNVLVQKTIEKPKATTLNGDSQVDVHHTRRLRPHGRREVIKDVEKPKEEGTYKKFSISEEGGVRVITIAGENKGAFMELGRSNKKHGFEGNPQSLHKKSDVKASKDGESGNDSSSNDEGKSKMKDKSQKTMAKSSPPMSAFMNSNVQGVNNSILHNCSCTHHDPGIHLALSRKPAGGHGIHLKDHANSQNS